MAVASGLAKSSGVIAYRHLRRTMTMVGNRRSMASFPGVPWWSKSMTMLNNNNNDNTLICTALIPIMTALYGILYYNGTKTAAVSRVFKVT
jgi:hypothetical protein